jgi:hypothetical protein
MNIPTHEIVGELLSLDTDVVKTVADVTML